MLLQFIAVQMLMCTKEGGNVALDVCGVIKISIWWSDRDLCQYAEWCQPDLIRFPEIRVCHAGRWLMATDWSSPIGSVHFPPSPG